MAQVRGGPSPRFGRLFLFLGIATFALAGCVKRDPHLDVSTKNLDLGTDRSSATFTVHNSSRDLLFTSGVAPLDYQIHTDVDWMTVTPASGSLGENERRTHTVEIDRSSLGDGDHTGLLLVTSNGGDATIVIHFVNGGVVSCTAKPTAPSGPAPGAGATGVATGADLSWSGGASQCPGLTATYDVHFGTSSNPPFAHDNGTSKSWDPGPLNTATTYFWQIVAKDANGSTSSDVWSFTTAAALPPPPPCTDAPSAACTPMPNNGKTGVSENANLAWGCGDSACGLAVSYDVYFGTNPTPGAAQLLGNTTTKAWNLPPIAQNTTFYWRVVTKDANGSTPGPVWSFKTKS